MSGISGADDRAVRAVFFLEQHLGHETYARNLMAARPLPGLATAWVPITYRPSGRERLPLPHTVRAVQRTRREVRSGLGDALGADVDVHVFNTQVPAVIGGRLARSKPYVLVTDITPAQYDEMAEDYGHRVDRAVVVRRAKHLWNQRVFRQAAAVVTWSSWAQRSMIDDYGVDADRTDVIPPGVDLGRWTPGNPGASETLNILFVGGDFVRKGGDDLLAAIDTLPAGRARLVAVTRTPLPPRDGLEVISDLQPNDDRLIELYRSADVFVLPSRSEAFGIAAVEASAAGVPVVASSTGGLADIVVDGENGFVIPPGDRRRLGAVLRVLLDDPTRRVTMGAAARQRAVAHFDAEANASRLFALVRECAHGTLPA